MERHWKVSISIIMAILVVVFLVACAPAARGEPVEEAKALVVYSGLGEYETARLLNKFTEETGIKTEFMRLSGGELIARVIIEKANPMGDIFFGGSTEGHEVVRAEGCLRPYKSPALAEIDPKFYDPDGYWSGFYVGAIGIIVNNDRFKKDFPGKEMPKTWEDLLNPDYKGLITYSSPNTSGTAYTFVAGQIFRLGEDKAWEYLENLSHNVGQYGATGAAPAQNVAMGEFTFGITFGHAITQMMIAGYKVSMIFPEQTGSEIGALSIINGGPNPKAAEMFVDWMLGREAQQLHSDLSSRISTHPEVTLPLGAIPLKDLVLVNYDVKWAADNKGRIVEEWNNRFGG